MGIPNGYYNRFLGIDNYSKCSFLLDTFDTSDYGGTGKTFNWNVIPDVLIKKIILAGGISEHNIEYIYNNLSPYAVDLSSSLESVPGKKDDKKLKSFFNKIEELRKNDGNIIKP